MLFFRTFSKILAFFFAFLVFIFVLTLISKFLENKKEFFFSDLTNDPDSKNKIAILNINGPIISDPTKIYDFNIFNSLDVIYPNQIKNFLNELEQKKISGLIISINSPGGSVSASKNIYDIFLSFKQKNKIPLYFHTSEILASGGYWVAQSGDKIFADYGSIIGSIGVKGPDWLYYNQPIELSSGLIGNSVKSNNGIQLFSNIAGKSKDIFNPFRKPLESELKELNEMIKDIYIDFINLVSSNRKIEVKILKNEIGAMIYNTKKAREMHLIDSEKNINEIINQLKNSLNLNSVNIITNKKNNKFSFLKLNILSNKYKKDNIEYHNLLIKNKFCNNLKNEISSVAINLQSSIC